MDVAWAAVMENAPMMADMGKYRTMMYEIFWLGKNPSPELSAQAVKDRIGKGEVTKGDLSALEALEAKAASLRGETKD